MKLLMSDALVLMKTMVKVWNNLYHLTIFKLKINSIKLKMKNGPNSMNTPVDYNCFLIQSKLIDSDIKTKFSCFLNIIHTSNLKSAI